MSDVTISYKGADIATMDATGSKTLQTQGKYCEGDISVAYIKPSGGGYDPFPIPEGYSLPSGYQKLAYCDSDGYQYCDSAVVPTFNTKIVLNGIQIPGRYEGYAAMTGAVNCVIASATNYSNIHYWTFGNKADFSNIYSDRLIPTFSLDKNEARVSSPPFPDEQTNCGATSFSVPEGTTIAICGRYSGRTIERRCPVRFWREQIYDDGVLIRYIVPTLKDGNEVCLYDLVTDLYMPNLGTGVLVGVLP